MFNNSKCPMPFLSSNACEQSDVVCLPEIENLVRNNRAETLTWRKFPCIVCGCFWNVDVRGFRHYNTRVLSRSAHRGAEKKQLRIVGRSIVVGREGAIEECQCLEHIKLNLSSSHLISPQSPLPTWVGTSKVSRRKVSGGHWVTRRGTTTTTTNTTPRKQTHDKGDSGDSNPKSKHISEVLLLSKHHMNWRCGEGTYQKWDCRVSPAPYSSWG